MRIDQLPEEERPMEKALTMGVDKLSNQELLALILRTGRNGESALSLAASLLGCLEGGIRGLPGITPQELMRVKGVGRAKACAVAAAAELGKRQGLRRTDSRCRICGAEDAAGLFMEELRYEKKEHFRCLLLDTRGQVISMENISTGELTSAPVHPREVFAPAVRKSAAAVILVHNHPSGDPAPSREDIRTTERLQEAGRLMGIRVLDHIIIGDGSYCSLADLGELRDPD